MKFATRIIHNGHTVDEKTGAVCTPLFHVSTYRQQSVDHFGKYDYGRGDNPTREALEDAVAQLEGGTEGFAFASGMAAISSVMMLLSQGDHIVVSEDIYGGAFRIITTVLKRFGITSTFIDATDPYQIEKAIRPETKALYLETPSNPLLKITDLRKVAEIAQRKGIITIVDNTFMTPYLQRPLELGCDIVLHSGTKFINGHSDVICGFAVVNKPDLAGKIRFMQNAIGAVPGPQDSWLVLRGLKTLKVRMDYCQKSAMKLALWLTDQQFVKKVYYPGLESHEGYEINANQSHGPGAVLSFELDTIENTKRLLEGAKLALFAVSLGGVESIISYPAKMSHASVPAEERHRLGITETLVRLSPGLEDTDDLIDDIQRAIGL